MRALVLRHSEGDEAGLVGDALAARGVDVETYLYRGGAPLPDAAGYDRVVVLGATSSVNDPREWIADEVEWLRRVPVPVLGICFGAQLLVAASGGSVEPSPAYEIGWVRVDPVPGDGRAPSEGPWFEWHGERCVLPPHARLLAANDVCVQAFTVGPHLGVQFHPEVDTAQVERWLSRGGAKAAREMGRDPDALLAETARREPDARRRSAALVDTFLDSFAGPGRLGE